MTTEKKGEATLFVRLQSRKHGINYKVASALTVDIAAWNKSNKTNTTLNNFRQSNPDLTIKMDTIKRNLDSTLKNETPLTKEEMREIIDAVVYAEAREAQKRKAEEKARKEAEAKRMTLNKYIDLYIEQVSNGVRQTEQGRNYAYSTVKAIKQAMKQFKLFQEETGRTYDFKDIDMTFYYGYTAYLKKKDYAINLLLYIGLYSRFLLMILLTFLLRGVFVEYGFVLIKSTVLSTVDMADGMDGVDENNKKGVKPPFSL